MTNELQEAQLAANAVADAQTVYAEAFNAYYDTLEVLEDTRFWQIMDWYREEVKHLLLREVVLLNEFTCTLGLKRNNRDAAHELLRKALVGHYHNFTVTEAMRFAKTYEAKVAAIYKPLFDTVEGRGDDGYDDLLDSLPLVGKEFYVRCLDSASFNGSNARFEKAVKEACSNYRHDTPHVCFEFKKFVLQGENYNRMDLKDKCQSFFKSETGQAEGD